MVQNVFMHTSATPGPGNANPASPGQPITNPNPASGYIVVQLQDAYARSLSGITAIASPLSGSNLAVDATALTVGVPYTITALGTSTAADWAALGVPIGVTPAIGVSFIAAAQGAGSGSGQVQAIASSNIDHIETVGDPNLSLAPNPSVGQGFGAQLILACLNGSNAVTAPANGTVISLSFYLNDSSVQVQGE